MNLSYGADHVTVVTVTYGDRAHLLDQMLRASMAEGVGHVIVVDNGAADDLATRLPREHGDRVSVVTLPSNQGSAPGFAAGLAEARRRGACWVLMLDDDNRLRPGALRRLLLRHEHEAARVPLDQLAVVAYRTRHLDQARAIPSIGMYGGSATSCLGFHVGDLPMKVFRRTPWGRRWERSRAVRPAVRIATAPYSGMLFHVSVLQRHGLPRADYVLYMDDIEFSSRLTRAGGALVLVSDAPVDDVEESWHSEQDHGSAFGGLLHGAGDFRVYYHVRNCRHFESVERQGAGWLRRLNERVFMAILHHQAVRSGRIERFELIRQAMADGAAARLGVSTRFPLP